MIPVFATSAVIRAPEALVLRGGRWRQSLAIPVRYGLVHHPAHGPVLIDTGYTEAVTSAPGRSPALRAYAAALRPELQPGGAPLDFLRRQGLEPGEVRHILLTHYHADHVAGLALFPQARVMGHGGALAALRAGGALQALRHGVFRELIPSDLESRFIAVEELPQAADGGIDLFGDGSLWAYALPGHADGHLGLRFSQAGLFYGTDAEWLLQALEPGRNPRFAGGLVAHNRAAAAQSRAFLRHRPERLMLCHDPARTEFDEVWP